MNNTDILQMVAQLRQNPMQFILQRGLKIPQGMNDPQQIVQHLMNTGQVSQEQYDKARQMAQQFMGSKN